MTRNERHGLLEHSDDASTHSGSHSEPPPQYQPLPPRVILSLVRQGLIEPREAAVARTFSVVSLIFLQFWLSIPAMFFAFKRKREKRIYDRSINLSIAACAIGLCFWMILLVYLTFELALSTECQLNDLPSITNGAIIWNAKRARVGSQRIIKCNDQYTIISQKYLTCLETGKWSLPQDTCRETDELQRKLGQAAVDGNTTEVQRLIKLGLAVDWRDAHQYEACNSTVLNGTALHRVTQCSTTSESVKLLVGAGANVNLKEAYRGSSPLMLSSQTGNVQTVWILLDKSAAIDTKNNFGETALMLAATYGQLETIRRLLERGANINLRNNDGWTALMLAARSNDAKVVELLIERGANRRGCNPGRLPLCPISVDLQRQLGNAAVVGNVTVVKQLLGIGYLDPNWLDSNKYFDCNHWMITNGSALHRATASGDCNRLTTIDIVRLLIEAGANVNLRGGPMGFSPLILAAATGPLETVVLLLSKGADVNLSNVFGRTPLIEAAHLGQTEIVKLLLDKGAHINARAQDGATAVWLAAKWKHLETVKILLDRGADVNSRNAMGSTALITAASEGRLEMVRLLVDKGADIYLQDNDGTTALKAAAVLSYNPKIADLLISRGASRDDFSRHKLQKQLVQAAADGNVTGVRQLVSLGYLNVDWMDAGESFECHQRVSHPTALLRATQCNSAAMFDVARLLIEAGANVNITDKGIKITPLQLAAASGNLETVRLLLDKGADINAMGGGGYTALKYAAENNKNEIVKLLLERGADRTGCISSNCIRHVF